MLKKSEVMNAFQVILEREPDFESIADAQVTKFDNMKSLRESLMRSNEFSGSNPDFSHRKNILFDPPLIVDLNLNAHQRLLLYKHIRNEWSRLGENKAYWSVLSTEDYSGDNLSKKLIEDFYLSGFSELDLIKKTLARCRLRQEFNTVLEYGCGVGRVSLQLAEIGQNVHAYDISSTHLEIAKKIVDIRRNSSITFHHVADPQQLNAMIHADFIYCTLVLQHNPPPLMVDILSALFGALNIGGVIMFQIPTYRKNYIFSVESYIDSIESGGGVEMHILPQCVIYKLAAENGLYPLEVIEDQRAGSVDIISNHFTFIKK